MTSKSAAAEPAALVAEFAATLDFPLDRFQLQACEALLAGDGVLVCAPTGAGKTVVGEFGLWAAMRMGRRAFYTTPLKALSNQKFTDLKAIFGEQRVGLLTGDNQVNGDAEIVVMTTEVLRNMIYEGSSSLDRLSVVVLDEVHYLADRSRGATWEEVLIQLPSSVRIAALSATVSNHEDFAAWLGEIRGDIALVVETHRPVPIEHRMLVDGQLFELLDEDGRGLDPRLTRRLRERERHHRAAQRRGGRRGPARRQRLPPVDRSTLVQNLSAEDMLPAISFVFSRAGCAKAVEELLRTGIRLTTREERRAIDEFADERLQSLDPSDHMILEVPKFRAALRNGISAHHAGMIPLLKETVEVLFARGLVKVVFATETLALGVNMPARTVVIERLTKWTGQSHEVLTPTEFTQLTGRAGRRGIDVIGFGVVCEPDDVTPEVLSSLATRTSSPLVSAFRPSYNMAVNLLRRMHSQQAEALLGRSFAQFNADRSVVSAEHRIARVKAFADNYREQLVCDCGDVWIWWKDNQERKKVDEEARRSRAANVRRAVRAALSTSPPGRVLLIDGHRFVVTERRVSKGGEPSLLGVLDGRQVRRVQPDAVHSAPIVLGDVDLPQGSPMESAYQDELIDLMDQLPPGPKLPTPADGHDQTEDHPVANCPKIKSHVHVCRQLSESEIEIARLEKQVRRRSGALARAFNGVCSILRQLGYLSDDEVTGKGERLGGIYASSDLVIAEAMSRGIFESLGPAELASTMSSLIHETRPGTGAPESPPTKTVARAILGLEKIASELRNLEEERGLELTGVVDGGLSASVYFWALGDDLEQVLAPTQIAAGDFVRSIKQLDDLLRQMAELGQHEPELAATARSASGAIRRGVVVAGGVA